MTNVKCDTCTGLACGDECDGKSHATVEPEPCEDAQQCAAKVFESIHAENGDAMIVHHSWFTIRNRKAVAQVIESYTSRLVQEAIITERNRCISSAIAYADNHGQEIMEGDLRGLLAAMLGEGETAKPDLFPRFETRSGITTDAGE